MTHSATMIPFEVPFAETTKSGQDVEHECIVFAGDYCLRAHIKSNAYSFQSHARAEATDLAVTAAAEATRIEG